MKTKDLDIEYNKEVEKEYQKQIKLLLNLFNSNPEISKEKKLLDFRNTLVNEFTNLTRVSMSPHSYQEDKFLEELTRNFSFRDRDYDENPVTNYLQKDLPDLRVNYGKRKEQVVFNELFEGSNIKIIKFLGKYFGIKKILADCSDLYPRKEDSIESVIEIISMGKENRKSGELNPAVIENSENSLINIREESSIRQRVLAMHYLFKSAGVVGIDKTAQARFIQFVTGKELGAKEIINTSIYGFVRNPFSLSDKQLLKDLQEVRIHFEKIGLMSVVVQINKEIEKLN